MSAECNKCGWPLATKYDAASKHASQHCVVCEQRAEIERLTRLVMSVIAEYEQEAAHAREAGFIGNALHWEREAKRMREAEGGE